MDKINIFLEDLLIKKAPVLPKNIKDFLVKYAYIFNLIGIFVSIPAILTLFGINSIIHVYGIYTTNSIISIIFLTLGILLRIKALKGLKEQKIDGWNMIYYATIVQAVYSLISYNLFEFIVGTLISLYFIFQVKSYYK